MSRIISLFMDDESHQSHPRSYGRRDDYYSDREFRDRGRRSRRSERRDRPGLIRTIVAVGADVYKSSQSKNVAGPSSSQRQMYASEPAFAPQDSYYRPGQTQRSEYYYEDYPREDYRQQQQQAASHHYHNQQHYASTSSWPPAAQPQSYTQQYPGPFEHPARNDYYCQPQMSRAAVGGPSEPSAEPILPTYEEVTEKSHPAFRR